MFSALLVQQRLNIILCFIALQFFVPSGKRFTNTFWGPAPALSPFFTLHDPKVIVRVLRECFEHRNTLVAAQSGHIL